jgi:hypothetical protein
MTHLESAPRLTELQFLILNEMMDDAEDVEQIYLAVNGNSLEAGSLEPAHPLRAIIDEVSSLFKERYVEAPRFCNSSLPQPLDSSLLHHYWFSPTEKGKQAWKAYKVSPHGNQR